MVRYIVIRIPYTFPACFSIHCEKRVLGQDVELEFVLYSRVALQVTLNQAGFEILLDLERAPHRGFEEGTRRGYVWFSKPRRPQ